MGDLFHMGDTVGEDQIDDSIVSSSKTWSSHKMAPVKEFVDTYADSFADFATPFCASGSGYIEVSIDGLASDKTINTTSFLMVSSNYIFLVMFSYNRTTNRATVTDTVLLKPGGLSDPIFTYTTDPFVFGIREVSGGLWGIYFHPSEPNSHVTVMYK